MHEQITKEFGKMNICMSRFGVRIGWRKYLYECTPLGYVNLWIAITETQETENKLYPAFSARSTENYLQTGSSGLSRPHSG